MAGTPLTELDRPLGQDRRTRRSRPWGRWLALGSAGVVGALLVALVFVIVLRRDPDGGQPMATAMIETRATPAAPAGQPAAPAPGQETRTQASARQLESESG